MVEEDVQLNKDQTKEDQTNEDQLKNDRLEEDQIKEEYQDVVNFKLKYSLKLN